jgi:hypothetical protein
LGKDETDRQQQCRQQREHRDQGGHGEPGQSAKTITTAAARAGRAPHGGIMRNGWRIKLPAPRARRAFHRAHSACSHGFHHVLCLQSLCDRRPCHRPATRLVAATFARSPGITRLWPRSPPSAPETHRDSPRRCGTCGDD